MARTGFSVHVGLHFAAVLGAAVSLANALPGDNSGKATIAVDAGAGLASLPSANGHGVFGLLRREQRSAADSFADEGSQTQDTQHLTGGDEEEGQPVEDGTGGSFESEQDAQRSNLSKTQRARSAISEKSTVDPNDVSGRDLEPGEKNVTAKTTNATASNVSLGSEFAAGGDETEKAGPGSQDTTGARKKRKRRSTMGTQESMMQLEEMVHSKEDGDLDDELYADALMENVDESSGKEDPAQQLEAQGYLPADFDEEEKGLNLPVPESSLLSNELDDESTSASAEVAHEILGVDEEDEESSLADRVVSDRANNAYPGCTAFGSLGQDKSAGTDGRDVRRRRQCPTGTICVRRRRFGHIRWDKEATLCLQLLPSITETGKNPPLTRLGMRHCSQMGDDGKDDSEAEDTSVTQDWVTKGPDSDFADKHFTFSPTGNAMCSGTAVVVHDVEECCHASTKLKKLFGGTVDVDYEPMGCYSKGTTHVYFNMHSHALNQSDGSQRVCKLVADSSDVAPFQLQWLGDKGAKANARCVESRRREYAQTGDVIGADQCTQQGSMQFSTQEVITCRRRRHSSSKLNPDDKCFLLKWHSSGTSSKCLKVALGTSQNIENKSFATIDRDHNSKLSEDEWIAFFLGGNSLMLADCSQDDETQIFH